MLGCALRAPLTATAIALTTFRFRFLLQPPAPVSRHFALRGAPFPLELWVAGDERFPALSAEPFGTFGFLAGWRHKGYNKGSYRPVKPEQVPKRESMSWQAKVYGRWQGFGRRKRRRPGKLIRTQVLAEQQNRCIYCSIEFGTVTTNRSGKGVIAKCTWDHFIPYIHDPIQMRPGNWLAACQVCNGAKRDLVFDSLVEARDYVLGKRWRRNAVDREVA